MQSQTQYQILGVTPSPLEKKIVIFLQILGIPREYLYQQVVCNFEKLLLAQLPQKKNPVYAADLRIIGQYCHLREYNINFNTMSLVRLSGISLFFKNDILIPGYKSLRVPDIVLVNTYLRLLI